MAKYKFFLYHRDLKNWKRIIDPKGWESMKRTRKRFGMEGKIGGPWHGVFYDFTNQLTFIKNGKTIIQKFRELYGPEDEILFKIEKQDSRTHVYETDYLGKLNLYSYVNNTVDVQVNIEHTGFTQSLINGNEIKIDLEAIETLDEKSMDAAPMITLPLHSKVILKRHNSVVEAISGETDTHTIYGNYTVADPSPYVQVSLSPGINEISQFLNYIDGFSNQVPLDSLKYNFKIDKFSSGEATFNFKFRVKVRAKTTGLVGVGGDSVKVDFTIIHKKLSGNYTDTTSVVALTAFDYGSWFDSGFIDVEVPYTELLSPTDEIYFYFKFQHTSAGSTTEQELIFDLTADNKVDVTAETVYPTSECQAIMIHEALQRTVQSLTGKANSFYSEFYGRTDLGYAVDGEGSLRAITSVNKIRGIDKSLQCGLSDLITTAWALDAIGIGIEVVDGVERVRVEPMLHWYQTKRMMRLSYVLDIKKGEIEELNFNQVEGGTDKWSNEQVANLDEPNSKKEWITPIRQVKNKLDLKCPYITGGYTIEFARRERDQPTKDTPRDDENVIIRVRRDGDDFVPEKDEDFTEVTGVISPETSYNLKDSPARCLRKHGRTLRASLEKKKEKYIKFQAGTANNLMVSTLTSETEAIAENEDILISSLSKPIFFAETYFFRAKLTYEQLQALSETDGDEDQNVFGFIEFSKTDKNHSRGYILSAELAADSNEVRFELIRANI
jgi:hypothetical protein